jgi:hypothetical protein
MSDSGEVVDARCLCEGEEMREMIEVQFPCHSARIRSRLDPYHFLMASMPQMELIRPTANWWLYRSPANAEVLKMGSEFQFQKTVGTVSSGEEVAGPAQPEKTRDKREVEPASPSQTPIHPEPLCEAAVGRRTYKEVLLTPVKEARVGKKKKRWKTRRKMAQRGQERFGEERFRRDDRADRERNWDMRRDAAGGGMSRGTINPARSPPPPPFPRQSMQWQRKSSSSTTQSSGQSSAPKVTPQNSSSQGAPKPTSNPNKTIVCYKCDVEGHNSKECSLQVTCLVYEKDTHKTRRCVWPNQLTRV